MRTLAVVLVAVVALALGLERLAPGPVARALVAMERARCGVRAEQRRIDGMDVAYLEGGSGEPLILVHGFGADKDNFTRVACSLTAHFRVLIPDLPGFGDSAKPADAAYDVPTQAERVRAFAQALGAGRPHLGGSSMGGFIVTAYALAHPGEVASLWLLGAAGTRAAFDSELTREIERTGSNPLIADTLADFDRTLAFVMARPPVMPYAIRRTLAARAAADAALHRRIFTQVGPGGAVLLDDRLTELRMPALVVWGAADRALNPRAAETYRALLPKARVVVMEGVGHLPMIEAPAATVQDYLAWRRAPAP